VDDKLLAKKAEETKPAGDAQGREVKKGEYLRKIAAETQSRGCQPRPDAGGDFPQQQGCLHQ
jgi:hypothetical protein